VRAAQDYAAAVMANSNVVELNIDGPQFTTLTPYASPGLHFDTGGQQALGAAFGDAVRTALPPPVLGLPQALGSNWIMPFAGVTGTTHTVERSTAVSGPWIPMTNIVIEAVGHTNYEDFNPPVSNAFYRVSRP